MQINSRKFIRVAPVELLEHVLGGTLSDNLKALMEGFDQGAVSAVYIQPVPHCAIYIRVHVVRL